MLEEYAPVLTSKTMMEVVDKTDKLPADCAEQTNDMEPKTETAAAARGLAQPLMQPPDFTTTIYHSYILRGKTIRIMGTKA